MSSTKTESPIAEVIFLQKIFRFAGRTVKDLVIINCVCKDFEETMQAHHTFNLVLYDNIVKKRYEENTFLFRSVNLLSDAPAWIVYQWTIVNERDETQRELLKTLLLFQAKNGNKILIRDLEDLNHEEDPSTTHELLRHILESCIKLGIVKEVLLSSGNTWNCVTLAISRKIPADSFKFLIESCAQHGLDMKRMLEQKNYADFNCILLSVSHQLPGDSFRFLIDLCVQHGVDVKKMLEQKNGSRNCIMQAVSRQISVDSFNLLIESCARLRLSLKKMLEEKDTDNWNCIMLACRYRCPGDSFKLLIESCVEHGLDMKEMLEHRDNETWTCLSLSTSSQLPFDSLRLLVAHFPSNESFQTTMSTKNQYQKRTVEYVKTEEIRSLLNDPDCWKKCRDLVQH